MQDGSGEMSSEGTGLANVERRDGLRVGFVAGDPLRLLGMQAIVEDWHDEGGASRATLVPLTLPGVLEDAAPGLVLIDAGCTEHLFVLLETLRRARPRMRMVVIGDSEDPGYIQRVIGAGARGYLAQTAREGEIRMALEVVSDGSVWAPRKVLARLLDGAAEVSGAEAKVRFTEREVEVLRLLVAGLGNRELAEELKIDASTVKAHLARLMRKVGAKNRVELTMRALKLDFDDADGLSRK